MNKDPHIKYIEGRWLKHPYDKLAIKCKGEWLVYKLEKDGK